MRDAGGGSSGAAVGGISVALSAEWREESGRQNAVAGSFGRIFDLVLVERPEKLASLAEATLEDALFESGRPVMMAPPTVPAAVGERVSIAWNGSTETARTVAFAMPFLERAKEVEVVSVEEGMTPGPAGEELARSLALHGMPVTSRHVQARGRTPGQAFLEEAKAFNADLLIKYRIPWATPIIWREMMTRAYGTKPLIIKGAYTQSRLRQLIFGGATRHIIMEATIPVLLAH